MRKWVRPLAFVALLGNSAALSAQIVINEVSAANLDQFADGFGEYEDWVELHNPTGAAVDISGWYLSDNPNVPLKWSFGPGTLVPANGR